MIRGAYLARTIMNTAITDEADDGDGVTCLQSTCDTAHFHCRAIVRLRGGRRGRCSRLHVN